MGYTAAAVAATVTSVGASEFQHMDSTRSTYIRRYATGQSAELWPRVLAESRSSGGLGRPGGPRQRPGSVGCAVLHVWHCAQPACARRHLHTSSNKVRCRCASLRKRNTVRKDGQIGWA